MAARGSPYASCGRCCADRSPGAVDDDVCPLADCLPGSYRRYDWEAEAFAETVSVEPSDLLVLEGVGSGCRMHDDLIGVLVWVEAPYEQRMRRGIDRDGEAFAPHWQAWGEAENLLFARHRTRQRADLVVDGSD